MIRFLSHLFGKPYETCKSCEILKQQLAFANEEKKELTATLLSILKPKVYEAAPIELKPITQSAGLWSRRREALEAKDRETARVQQQSKFIASSDKAKTVEALEAELDIAEGE